MPLNLSRRVESLKMSPTMKISQKAIELKSNGEDVIDFSVGEPDFPTPENVKVAAINAIQKNFTKYTINSGTFELRKAISEKLKRDNKLDYSPNEIIVSSGAKQSIYNAILSIVEDGDEVIIPAPYYVSYPHIVELANGKSVFINTKEENGFKLSNKELKSAITEKTKLLIICNPSNPTGAAYSKNDLEEIAPILEDGNFYILSDEIYEKITYDNFEFVSIASLSERIKSKTITINGHSKSYSMTGWRIGYAAGPLEVINAMNKIQSHSTSNASSISQAAALEALQGSQNFIEEVREEFELRRNFIYNEIISIKGIKCYKPLGAFYVFPNVSFYFGKKTNNGVIENSLDLAMYLLNEAKVVVVPGSAFGFEGYIRISYSTSMYNLKEGMHRIKIALEKLLL
ncbi:MAG: pyridoxal phosphate-dependent aminotransferase [Melioribacter sp.]|nr:pyridoxal phosphate-dependent aminotransferase [Melioribacter sp.]